MANLAVKYRPKTFEDLTEQSIIAEMLSSICKTKPLDCRNFLLIGPAGTGKAQPMYSKVLTPNGFIHMSDVKIGTEVFTHTGCIAKVSEIYPQGKRPIYEIKLQDGTTIRVADNHLNMIYRYNQDKKLREDFVVTTTELLDLLKTSKFRLRIDLVNVDWSESSVPIDPYLLGALIGDGSLSSGGFGFSNSEPDVIEKVDSILRRDWSCCLRKVPGDNVDYAISPIETRKYVFTYDGVEYSRPDMVDKLESLGYPRFDGDTLVHICQNKAHNYNKKYPELSSMIQLKVNDIYQTKLLRKAIKDLKLDVPSIKKHIPVQYLLNSRNIRLQLLQGLYDTDGYSSGTSTEFSTSSHQLSEDFAFLVRSLGARNHICVTKGSYKRSDGNIKECNLSYNHTFKFSNDVIYCTSKKHCSRIPNYQHPPMRNIVSIEYVGEEDCQCIYVEHSDHTYISDNFIPTHNTTSARIMANMLNDNKGEPIELDAASHSGIDSIREIISQARSYPVGCEWKVFIVDECFHPNTLVNTAKGEMAIKDVHVGDSVYGINGLDTVINVFENKVSPSNLICVKINGVDIITTKSHLFFTDEGWVEAQHLKTGDALYDYEYMRSVWERVPEIFERSKKNLFKGMCSNTANSKCSEIPSNTEERFIRENLSRMWEGISDISEHKFNNLFSEVWKRIYAYSRFDTEAASECGKALVRLCLSRMWEDQKISDMLSSFNLQSTVCSNLYEEQTSEKGTSYIHKVLCDLWKYIQYNESRQENMQYRLPVQADFEVSEGHSEPQQGQVFSREQSIQKSDVGCKNESNQTEKQLKPAERVANELRKWTSISTSEAIERIFRRWLGVRVCSTDSSRPSQQNALSYELQTRPCLSRFKAGDRGGWSGTSIEFTTAAFGSKEDNLFRESRVESVEIYEPGNNDELFRSYFSDSELHSEYVTMFDLELKNHPSYFANNILVHNCHSLSNAAWQALLKTLEEGPAKSVFILCTTNPEKIPATVLSRVQTFQLSKISLKGIESRLKYVIEQENLEGRKISYTDDAINYIAKMAQGGMRDSLTLLDKALTYSKEITSENLAKALNLPKYDDFFNLLTACVKHDNIEITKVVNDVYNSGVNFVKWFTEFHSFVMNIVKYIFLQDINQTMIPSYYADRISNYTTKHSAICLKLANKLIKMNTDLKTTQYLQETALTYLCTVPQKKV